MQHMILCLIKPSAIDKLRYWWNVDACLRACFGQAVLAVDVELHAVPYNLTRDVGSDGPQDPLHGGVPELPHCPALYADGMVVMLAAGQAVL
jgi:hypothetical protein